MIGVTLIMRALPGQGEALAAFWQQVAMDVRSAEPGCLQVSVVRDTQDPEQFVIFERYASQAALDHHHATEYSKSVRPKLEALRIAPIQRFVGPIIT